MPHRILNLDEVSEMLHITRANVLALVKYNEIPYHKSGDKVLFRKIEIDAWASRELLGYSDKQLEHFHRESSIAKQHDLSASHALMPELLHPDCIASDFRARTKDSVLRGMVALAENSNYVYDPPDLLESLRERENMHSTAVGLGVALLHPRHHEPYSFEDSFIALGRATAPVHFGAPDDQPTDIFFLVCSQADNIHLHLLARLSMMVLKTDLLEDIRHAADASDIEEAIHASENALVEAKLPSP